MKISTIYDFRKETRKPADIGTVSIRIYDDGRQRFLSTGVRCRRSEWSAQGWVVGRPDADELNEKIKAAYDEAVASVGSMPVHSLRQGGAPFLDWVAKEIETLRLAEDTVYRHRQLLRKLEAYGKIKTFRDVTPAKLNEFLNYLATRKTRKVCDGHVVTQQISQTSVYTYWRRMTKWIHLAEMQGLIADNVVARVKVPRGEFKEREFLTREEMDRWLAATPPYAQLMTARDVFAVQCGTGLAYVDLMEMDFSRIQKNGEFYTLTGVRHKTRKQFFIVMLPFAKEALDRLGGVVPALSNQRYNDALKKVAVYAHIYKDVSSHVGRHTYACLCLSAGVRIEAVQRTLGHADIRTTQIYAKLVDQDVLAAFENTNLFNSK